MRRRFRDNPEVRLTKNMPLDKALRFLKRRVQNYGTFKALKYRKLNPAPGARARYKRYESFRRYKKRENHGRPH